MTGTSRSAGNDDRSVCSLTMAAVIVIYQPDIATLGTVLAAVAPQVSRLLLIANDGVSPALALPGNAELLVENSNAGLGKAYNVAVDWARANGATHLVLLDQDSVPDRNMVAMLGEALSGTPRVAAAGPLWRDARTGEPGYFVRLTRWGATKVRPADGATVSVDFLISSGAVISLEEIDRVGAFDEALFIDHVDTDWCLRARATGCTLLGVADAGLDHVFGEAALTTPLVGRGRRVILYPAERQYYLVRNSIILWHRPYAPMGWVLHDVQRTAALVCWHILFAPPRWTRLKSAWRGVCDGLKAARTRLSDRPPVR